MAVNNVSVTVPTAVSVGSKVDIVCSWDNGDSPPRHPVVRLTGGDGTEKTGLKLTETSQNQKKSTQQTKQQHPPPHPTPTPPKKQKNKQQQPENNVLKVTIPFAPLVIFMRLNHNPSLVNGCRLSGIVTVAL